MVVNNNLVMDSKMDTMSDKLPMDNSNQLPMASNKVPMASKLELLLGQNHKHIQAATMGMSRATMHTVGLFRILTDYC